MSESTASRDLETAVDALLAQERKLTPETIRGWIARFRNLFEVDDAEAESLARRLEARHDVTMSVGTVLTERDYQPWLAPRLAEIEFYYWSRYRKYLQQKDWSHQVTSTLDDQTARVLDLLEDPRRTGPWARRGMVVGHVQSGKTANYIGVLAKAADAGYRLIIVIAGVHNNLRNQTQKRLDEGFVGRDSARLLARREERYVGVGFIDAARRPVTFTNSVKDFTKEMATGVGVPLHSILEPAVFVVKKNAVTLRNLVEWLREHNAAGAGRTVDLPMLLIDDEADNASINVNYDRGEVSRINGQIRELLAMFSRSCYLGYTATPFANIFIDPETDDEMLGQDLFPRHFIVSLDPPTNYIGPGHVFRDHPQAFVRHIDDSDSVLPLKHSKDLRPAVLPASLATAVRAFVVARALRLLRGDAHAHCSMLVNVSRFTAVQSVVRVLVQGLVETIQASARVNGGLPPAEALRDPELAALHKVWQAEYHAAADWAAVQAVILSAAAPVRVVEVNSQSSGTLNYGDYDGVGLSVIAVGGFALSRGLTLEGLMISYFLRNSVMYDTLMQMGRWFGYRPGYTDLCRVWLTEEAEGWYAHVADSFEMLREELRQMAAAGATPEEFGLKVRAHPDTLIVTARNKMGAGERVVVSVGLANSFIETHTLRNDDDALRRNRGAVSDLIRSLTDRGQPPARGAVVGGGRLVSNVPADLVIGFVRAFEGHPASLTADAGPVIRYIQRRAAGELAAWDILFPGVSGPAEGGVLTAESLGLDIVCQVRSAGRRSSRTTLKITNKQRVASRGAERAGLTTAEVEAAEASYRQSAGTRTKAAPVNYPDHIYRAARQRPLLIVHLLDVRHSDGTGNRLHAEPVVAWSMSFPRTGIETERVEYIVTTTWLRENAGDVDEDDDE